MKLKKKNNNNKQNTASRSAITMIGTRSIEEWHSLQFDQMSFGLFTSFADGASLYQVLCSDAACRGSRTAATTKISSRNFMFLLQNKLAGNDQDANFSTTEGQRSYDQCACASHAIFWVGPGAGDRSGTRLQMVQYYDVIIIERGREIRSRPG